MESNLKMTAAEHEELAHRIYAAVKQGEGIDPPSETIDYTFDDAYQVRRKLVDKLIADGGSPKGHKIGFTSVAMQKMYGMNGPDFGQLLDNMFVPYGRPIPIGHMCNTRAEPELAFELGKPLAGPNVDIAQVLEATVRVWPAVEVIDSRVGAMRASANDSIADNAGAGWVILGETSFSPDELDLVNIPIVATVGDEIQEGISGDVMDHPAAPVAWLANRLTEIGGLGGTLNAGDIVISGSSTRSMAVFPGSKLTTSFGPMGVMELNFQD